MAVTGKKKTNSAGQTVRFKDVTDHQGHAKTDRRRQLKTPAEKNSQNTNNKFTSSWLWILSTLVLLCAIVALSYRGYLDTRAVNYPYQGPKVIQKNSVADSVLWGTYRPGAYLGLRTKEPLGQGSVAAGLMWYSQHDLKKTGLIDSTVRHLCDNAHENLIYGYVEHNAINYGHQVIKDGKENGFTLHTIFLRPNINRNSDVNTDKLNSDSNTDWTTRITYETNNTASSVSLVWYVYIDPGEDELPLNNQAYSLEVFNGIDGKVGSPLATVMGLTPSLSDFRMSIIPNESNNKDELSKFSMNINTSITRSWCSNMAMLKHCLAKSMVIKRQVVNNHDIDSQIVLVDEEEYKKHDSGPDSSNLKNFIAIQVTISHSSKKSPENASKLRNFSYSFDIAYTQKNVNRNTPPILIGNTFDELRNDYSTKFYQKFQEIFPITLKENDTEKSSLLDFARVTFSNMAGSLGYFYGSSLVRDDDSNLSNNGVSKVDSMNAVKYWRAGLLTAVPSRSQFPRGFLWDDGFHGLMLGCWNVELQLHILGHWMDLLNHQGWIPREQILGSEARSKVPEEFVVQSSRAANPPALLLTVDLLLRQIKQQQQKIKSGMATTGVNEKLNFDEIDSILRRLYPRLQAWYTWFNRTQKAVHSNAKHETSVDPDGFHFGAKFIGYRWRGRDAMTNRELNPKTLTSGMDDYPRSSHPVNDKGTPSVPVNTILNTNINDFEMSERHVDLHCWMAHGARIMNDLHIYLQSSGIANVESKYSKHFWMLVKSLDHLHWTEGTSDTSQNSKNSESSSSKIPMYADYGVHTDDVKLIKRKDGQDSLRVTGQKDSPKWRFVDSHIGYNALFPMFFRLVKDSQRLNAILDLIEGIHNGTNKNHSLLTKNCGLRSLSKSSSLYKVRNTMHDPPYWRGSVWINMQYLACSSLHYYANLPEDVKYNYKNNDEFENLEPIQYLDTITKQRCNKLYNKIRNDVIQCVYKEWKRTGYVWEQYEDEPVWDKTFGSIHKGKGTRPFTGWSANVVLLMAEMY